MDDLIAHVNGRISHTRVPSLEQARSLMALNKQLTGGLAVAVDGLKDQAIEPLVKSIGFLPKYQLFGLSKHVTFLRPEDWNEIDLTLLLGNTFTEVSLTCSIEPGKALWIESLFPFENPNDSYLNWLTDASKSIGELALYRIKKEHRIFNLERHLTKAGWNLHAFQFKDHAQRTILRPDPDAPLEHVTTVNCGDLPAPGTCQDLDDYEDLALILPWKPFDLKLTSTRYKRQRQAAERLLEKGLITPHVELGHVGLEDFLTVFIPSVKEDFIDPLVRIFSFFPLGTVRELEGRFFLKGMREGKERQVGVMATIRIPDMKLGALTRAFQEVFEALGIDHYLITSLSRATVLLEDLYGDELKEYEPLKNLLWNEQDKTWHNVKLYDEQGPIQPSLVPENRNKKRMRKLKP
jgi:hypothetical protein